MAQPWERASARTSGPRGPGRSVSHRSSWAQRCQVREYLCVLTVGVRRGSLVFLYWREVLGALGEAGAVHTLRGAASKCCVASALIACWAFCSLALGGFTGRMKTVTWDKVTAVVSGWRSSSAHRTPGRPVPGGQVGTGQEGCVARRPLSSSPESGPAQASLLEGRGVAAGDLRHLMTVSPTPGQVPTPSNLGSDKQRLLSATGSLSQQFRCGTAWLVFAPG